jgi:hypothetical protein
LVTRKKQRRRPCAGVFRARTLVRRAKTHVFTQKIDVFGRKTLIGEPKTHVFGRKITIRRMRAYVFRALEAAGRRKTWIFAPPQDRRTPRVI